MKQIFTLLSFIACSLAINKAAFSQCNYSSGANGLSTATTGGITVDGNMNDWTPFLNDPDNNSYDNTGGIDLDGLISDIGRDLTRFAFTEDANYLYIYLQRAGSTNNSVDILFYADINNNDMMDYREPVIHMNWSGANGNVTLDIYNYVPSLIGTLNNVTLNLDGLPLMGTLSYRGSAGSADGQGSADGKAVEAKIPFSKITQLNSSGSIINQLGFGQDFKFHVSTINGNVSSIPGLNSINDNFGGCLKAPVSVLPVNLVSFQGNLNNNKVILQWTVAENETDDRFEIERSVDGINFTTAALVFTSEKAGSENYMFYENLNNTGNKIYYRLKMYDKSQAINYSKILTFQTKVNNSKGIKIVSNPVTDKLSFSFHSDSNQQANVKIYDTHGRLQMNRAINTYEGSNLVSLSLTSAFSPGIYVIELSTGAENLTAKFIKL
jgi:hypothetical protein